MDSDMDLPLTQGERVGPRIVRAGVRIVALHSQGGARHCLFVHHQVKGWELPGGALDPGESPDAGARRELREETGIVLPGGTSLALLTFLLVEDQRGGHWADIVFWIDLPQKPDPRTDGEMTTEWMVLPIAPDTVSHNASLALTALTAADQPQVGQ